MKFYEFVLSGIMTLAPLASVLTSCSSSQDETDLEATEPVEPTDGAKPAEPAAPVSVEATSATGTAAEESPSPAPSQPPSGPPTSSSLAPSSEPQAIESVSAPFAGSTSRRVLYVKADHTKVFGQASLKSNVVGRLNKGDHVLVDIAGEWARTSEGHFVSMNSLSEKGIGRKKGRNAWRNSTGVEVSRKLQGKKSSGKKQKKATEQAEVEEVAPAQASAPPAAKAEGQGKAPKEAGSGDATP